MAPSTPLPTNWRLEGKDAALEAPIGGHFPALSPNCDNGRGRPPRAGKPPPTPRFLAGCGPPSALAGPGPAGAFAPQLMLPGRRTHPELGEVGIGGVVGLVVGVQQDGDDVLLFLRQLGPQTVLQGFLLLPLQDHLPLPLHLLIRQDDCGAGRGVSGGLGSQRNQPPGAKGKRWEELTGWAGASCHGGLRAHYMDGKLGFLLKRQVRE